MREDILTWLKGLNKRDPSIWDDLITDIVELYKGELIKEKYFSDNPQVQDRVTTMITPIATRLAQVYADVLMSTGQMDEIIDNRESIS